MLCAGTIADPRFAAGCEVLEPLIKPRVYCCLLVCLFAHSTHAQTLSLRKAFGRYQQFVWQDRDGLPENSVNAITRTRDGYLWLGTFEGLARFDGVNFTVFDRNNTPALGSSQVLALLEDHAGNLWIGTNGGGLIRYSNHVFTPYTTSQGLTTNFIRVLAEDGQGNLWVGTYGGGVNRFHDGRFNAYTTKNGLPDDHVQALSVDRSDRVWVGTGAGLTMFESGRLCTYMIKNGLPNDMVTALLIDHSGTFWVGTFGGALYQFENERFIASGLRTRGANVTVIYEDRDSGLWVGSDSGGLALFEKGGRSHYTRSYYTKEQGLPVDNVKSIYQDPEGNVWIGEDGGGLCELRMGRFTALTTQDGLPADYVTAVYQDAAGSVWVGTLGGLARLKPGSMDVFTARNGLPDGAIPAIAEDSAGNIWVPSGGKLRRFSGNRFIAEAVLGKSTNSGGWTVLGDSASNLWVGTRGQGLALIHKGQVTQYTKRDGLADDDVLTLYEDREGSLWVGTVNGGISRFHKGRFSTWTTKDGLATNHVTSFYQDQNGSLWIGTGGGGLSRFRDGRFVNITVKDGLYDDLQFQILSDTPDDSGSLWMSCNRGIYRVPLQELNDFAEGRRQSVDSYVYGVADGMLSRECNGGAPAGWKTRDGRLWFATERGVVAIDPRRRDSESPVIAIEQVLVDRHPASATDSLRIGPSQQSLEIRYTAFDWIRPQQVRFKYRMEGLDAEWIDAGDRRVAYYSHLPHGNYTFRVIADNGEGLWNTNGKTLQLSVLPPFYFTWWFEVMVALGTLGALVLAYRYRIGQLMRTQLVQQAFSRQLLASQETERKRIAAELHDSLGQRLLIMKNLALLQLQTLARNGSKVEKLEELSEEASRAISEVREISYGLRPYQLDRLGLTKAIEAVVRTAGSVSKTVFSTDLDNIDSLFPEGSRILIYRIVQEGLNNILKHADATEAHVIIHHETNTVRLTISDNGKGFTPGMAQANQQNGGFGLIGITERVQVVGGRVITQSLPGRGTSILIEFDLRHIANG